MLKRTSVWWLLIALVTTVFLAGTACKSDKKTTNGGSESPAATSSGTPTPYTGKIWAPDEILAKDGSATKTAEVEWGYMFELSGGILSGFGVPVGDGVKMAVKEINDAGGFQVGDTVYTIKLIEKDTHASVQDTIAAATELVQDKHVNVIWGPATVGDTESTAITQQAHVLHICPCNAREKNSLSTIDKAHGESKWAFETLLPFSLLIGQGARNFVKEWPDMHTVAFVCVNSEVGHDVCGAAVKAYGDAGMEVVSEEYFPNETTDYSPFITKLVSKNVDYLFNFADPPNDTQIVKKALELGVGKVQQVNVPADLVRTLVGRALTVPVIVGAAPRQAAQTTSQGRAPFATDYFARYKAYKNGDLPFASFVSLLTYDYVYMLAGAMQQAGTVEDTTAIADALEKFHFKGVGEDDIFFNRRHMGIEGTDPCTVQEGKPIVCTHNPPPPEAIAD